VGGGLNWPRELESSLVLDSQIGRSREQSFE
jgi:hypothetical protein